jgi:hypothetical protein
MKLSEAASRVRWLKADEINVLRTISVLILRALQFPEDEDTDGSRNVGFISF